MMADHGPLNREPCLDRVHICEIVSDVHFIEKGQRNSSDDVLTHMPVYLCTWDLLMAWNSS